jgi:hypothetical protein
MKNFKVYTTLFVFSIFLTIGCSEDSVNQNPTTSSESTIGGGTTGQGGSTTRFTIANDHLYIVTSNTLYTYSLANASKPEFKEKVLLSWGVETIFSMGDHLFLGTQNGVLIYSISEPTSPLRVGTYTHITSCDPVVAAGNFAYSTLRTTDRCNRGVNRLDIIDIEDVTNPRLLHSYTITNPQGLGIAGDYLYVCDAGQINTYDISNPRAGSSLVHSDALLGCYDVTVNNNVLIVVSVTGVTQYEINAANGKLTKLSSIERQ